MESSDSSDDAGPPKKVYKSYLDADHPTKAQPPRTTIWNIENLPKKNSDKQRKQDQQEPNNTAASCIHGIPPEETNDPSSSSSGSSSPDSTRGRSCAESNLGTRIPDSKNDCSSPSSGHSSPHSTTDPSCAGSEFERRMQSHRSGRSSTTNRNDPSSSHFSAGNPSPTGKNDQCPAELDSESESHHLDASHSTDASGAANDEDDRSDDFSDYDTNNTDGDLSHASHSENVTHQHGNSVSPSHGSLHAANLAAGGGGRDPDSSPDGSSDDNSSDGEYGGHFSDGDQNDIEGFSDEGYSDDNGGEDAQNNPPINNQPPEPPPSPPPPPGAHQLRDKLRAEYSARIEDNVAASRAEVLLNIQEFCKQHPLPLTAQEDLHKLINSMFYKEVIPESKYKLDQLYAAAIKFRYFFYCSKCFSSLGEVPNFKEVRVKKCDECQADNIIHDLTKASFFVIIEFVDQLQLLLEDPKIADALKNPNEFPDNGNNKKDLYDGEVYKRFVASLEFGDGIFYMSFCASTDGTPLFRLSSKCSIWPIFISINELPPYLRMLNILIAGLWFGNSHPKMDLFLEPFASYIRQLSDPGFSLNVLGQVRRYKGYLLGMCMDSGARGSVQCVHSHMGESPCNWCLHPGEVEGDGSNARKFIQYELQPAKRTAEQMIRDGVAVLELPGKDNHVNGVIGLSPLLRCPKFDIVDGMILDTLHWASFGIARRFVKLWLGEAKKKKKKANADNVADNQTPLPEYYVGTEATRAVIDARISRIRPPREARRLLRFLILLNEFSAREWENLLLYFSVPLFKNILPDRYLKHWTLFVQAFYLLMKSDLNDEEIRVARILMQMYLDRVFELYGRKELTFNMHISNHAADNAMNWGNGWSVSMYAFENGNKNLKSIIHAERGIPHQVIRSLQRDCSLNILRAEASTAQSDSFRTDMARKEVKKSFYAGSVWCLMPKEFQPSDEERWHCQQTGVQFENFMRCTRIVSRNICYASSNGRSRTDNSFCCAGGNFFKIRNIIAEERSSQVFLFVSKVRCNPYPLPDLPRTVTSVNFSPFLYTVDLIEEGTAMISCETLESKICVFMEVDCRFYKGKFLSVMANTCNVF